MGGVRGRPRRGTIYREVWRVRSTSQINNRNRQRLALRNKMKEEKHLLRDIYIYNIYICFFSRISTFQLLEKPWSQVSSLLPQVLGFNFDRARGSAISLLVDFSLSFANSRSRAFRKSICAQEKVPTNIYEYALGGIRSRETDLYQVRGQPDTPPG